MYRTRSRDSGKLSRMSLAAFPAGERELLQGDFGEMWLRTTAAGCGIGHERQATVDIIKADLALTLRRPNQRPKTATVWVQVKTTISPLRDLGDQWAYDLDVNTYEVLRDADGGTRRVLAVIEMSADGETIRIADDGTLLVGRTTWMSLEGLEPTTNADTQVVHLPKDNVLDHPGLLRMLNTFGVPTTTPVPTLDSEWG